MLTFTCVPLHYVHCAHMVAAFSVFPIEVEIYVWIFYILCKFFNEFLQKPAHRINLRLCNETHLTPEMKIYVYTVTEEPEQASSIRSSAAASSHCKEPAEVV